MKIIITGSGGRLGSELCAFLKKEGRHQFVAADRRLLDITDLKRVREFIAVEKPSAVVNCAAVTKIDRCEADPDLAWRVNALGAANLAMAAFNVGASVVQLSTDYVFDGTAVQPIRELDSVNPLNQYGKSKLAGETMVRETNPRHFILRTGWLFGSGRDFPMDILTQAKLKNEICIAASREGTPTGVRDVAECICALLRDGRYGTYHATCEGSCSRYTYARKVLDLAGSSAGLKPVTEKYFNNKVQRPRYTVLDNYMLRLTGLYTFRHWEEALEEYIGKLISGGVSDGRISIQ